MFFNSQRTLEETKQVLSESVAESQRLQSELDRIRQAKSDLRTAIQNQGVTVPDDAKIDTYSTYVDGISTVRSVADVLPDDRGNVPLTIDDLNGLSDIKVVSTSTAESGTPASVEVAKSGSVANLSFIIPKGEEGKAATIEVGTVTTGEAGSNATVTNAGTTNAARLNFVIPRGDKGEAGLDGNDGKAATIEVGTVTTGNPGTEVKITNSGNENAATFNFTIPRGEAGLKGEKGNDGYTPIKGTDYWTDSDKQEITNEVLNNTAHKYVIQVIEANNWQDGSDDIYNYTFTNSSIPADCKLDIAFDTQDILQLISDGVSSIRADNDNGIVNVVCIGAKPTASITAQISFVKIVQAQ